MVGSLLLVGGTAFAQTTPAPQSWGDRAPGVFGTVSAISGNTITLNSKGFGPNAAATTYTVDATNATVTKNGASSSVSNIAVGDTIMVVGSVSGTNVTATKINDGLMGRGGMGMRFGKFGSTTPMRGGTPPAAPFQGNGEPIIGGDITAINGNTLTVTNKAGVTYTVDATNATVVKGNASSTLSSVAVGDNVVVQGTVNGNSVTASSVIDQGASQTSPASGSAPRGFMDGMGRFFGGLGGLLHNLFGFF